MGLLPKITVQAAADAFTLAVPGSAKLEAGAAYELAAHGPDALLLVREGAAPQGYFAADLSCLGMAEVFAHLVSGGRSGQLVVTRGPIRRVVWFREGQVTFAISSAPYERLGRVLTRRKLVTAGQLDEALARVRPGLKLGQVLTQAKRVTPSALYAAMAEVVKEIALGLFELVDGHALFLEGAPPAEDSVKLAEPTRELALQAVRRGEQAEKWRRRLGPTVQVVAGAGAAGADAPLVAKAGQGATISALREAFEGSEFMFLSTLDRLTTTGALVISPAPAAGPSPAAATPVTSTFELYRSLVCTICAALENAGKDLSDLRSFFADPLPGLEKAFEGVSLSDDGMLDVARVRANTTAADEAVARAAAYEALDAFVSYALFSAKNVLPETLAQVLGAEFRRIREGAH